MATIAATLLGRTRSADLWRYPIEENVNAIGELAARGVPMSVVSNAAGQIEWVLEWSGVCQREGPPSRCGQSSTQKLLVSQNPTHRSLNSPSSNTQKLQEIEFHVGDSVSMDVNGSRAAGLVPVLIDPFDDHDAADFACVNQLLI